MELEIDDLSVLDEAAKELGGQLIRNQTTYKWYGKYMNDWPLPEGTTIEDLGKCDHALKFKNATYEVGVVKRKNGKFELRWDFWSSGGLNNIVGRKGEKLKDAYTEKRLTKEFKKKNLKFTKTIKENGAIQLEVLL